MINIESLSLFPKSVQSVYVPSSSQKKYNVIFYSENSNFFKAYPLLGLKPQYIKRITALSNSVPYLKITSEIIGDYKKLGLFPVYKVIDTDNQNLFIDCSYFLDLMDSRYSKGNYNRSSVLNKVIDYLNTCRSLITNSNRRNVLLYHVDISKDVPKNIMFRRSWPLLYISKDSGGKFPFDYVLVCLTNGSIVKYFLIYSMNSKPLSHNRIFNILKSISRGKSIDKEEDISSDKDEDKDDIGSEEEDDQSEETDETTPETIPEPQQDETPKQLLLRSISNFLRQ